MKDKKTLYIILFVQFIEVTAYAMLLPLIPFYAQSLGADPIIIGSIFALYSFFQLLISPFLGRLSDIYGRRSILLIGQLGTFLGFLILGFSHSLFLIFVSRFVDGITGGNQTVSYAIASDISTQKKRSQIFGYLGATLGIGLLVGPGIGAFLYQFGFSVVAFITAGVMLVSTIITATFLSETRVKSDIKESLIPNFISIIKRPNVRSILIQIFSIVLITNTFILGFPVFAQKQFLYSAQYVGYALTFMGFIGIVTQTLLLGKIVSLIGDVKTSQLGFLMLVVGFLVLSITNTVPVFLISLLIIIPGTVLVSSTISSLLTQSVSEDKHGEILGIHQSVNSVCQIIGPLLAGFILAKLENFYFGLIIAIIAILGIILSFSKRSPN